MIILTFIAAIVVGIIIAVRTKKDDSVVYGKLDKAGRVTNIILLAAYLCFAPFYLFIGSLSRPAYDGFLGIIGWIVTFIISCAPLFCGIGLGLSVRLRKQGKSKPSFIVQFAGIAGILFQLGLFCIFYGNLLSSLN